VAAIVVLHSINLEVSRDPALTHLSSSLIRELLPSLQCHLAHNFHDASPPEDATVVSLLLPLAAVDWGVTQNTDSVASL
jgi:hypothetical protein